MAEDGDFRYELFIVHAAADRPWVDGYLRHAMGVEPARLITPRDFTLGAAIPAEFDRAVASSRYTALVLSPAFLADRWAEFGEQLISYTSVEEGRGRVVVLTLYQCQPPPRLRFRVGLDCTDWTHWDEEAKRLRDLLGHGDPQPEVIPCPYPGMSPFRPEDARFFFGRDAEIQDLLTKLRAHRFLMVIGSSGSGKSSLVLAGLLPRLADPNVFPPGTWKAIMLRPGVAPCAELAARLGGDPNPPEPLLTSLLAAGPPAQRLLLYVDQFEEVFSLVKDRAEQDRFLSRLQAMRADARCVVMGTMRADFYGDLMSCALWPVADAQQVKIAPPRGDALRRAIVAPAENVGVCLEDSLVERLLADADDEPGALPMLQEALVLLWGRRQRRIIARRSYDELGRAGHSGLAVAMATRADATLAELPSEAQQIARRIFLRLVQFGEGRPDTRRQLTVAELRSKGDDSQVFDRVLATLIDHRLLTPSADERLGRRVDIAHEMLIIGWPASRVWAQARRDAEQTRRRLAAKADEWIRLGRGDGGLLDPVELAEAGRWLSSPDAEDLGIDADVQRLIEASRQNVWEQQNQERKRKKLLQAVFAFCVVASIVASITAIVARIERGRADKATLKAQDAAEDEKKQTEIAKAETRRANDQASEALTSGGVVALEQGHSFDAMHRFARAIAVVKDDDGAQANKIHDNRLRLRFLQTAVPHLRAILSRHGGAVNSAAFSPDGARIVTASDDRSARVWKVASSEFIELKGHGGAVRSAAFSQDGTRVVTASKNTAAVYDAASGKLIVKLEPAAMRPRPTSFSPNPARVRVASVSDDATLRLHNASHGIEIVEIGPRLNSAAFSPDGTRVVTASDDGKVRVWEVASRKFVELKGHTGAVNSAVFSPDGTRIVTASDDGTARVWEVASGKKLAELGHPGRFYWAAFNANGERVVTASNDGTARVWNTIDGKEIARMEGTVGMVRAAVFSPRAGKASILTAGSDGTARVWDVASRRQILELKCHDGWVNSTAFSPDGARIVTALDDGTVRVWDIPSSQSAVELKGHAGAVFSATFDREGTRVVTASEDCTARVYDAADGKLIVKLETQAIRPRPTSFSPNPARVRVASVSDDATLRLHKASHGRFNVDLGKIGPCLNSTAFSPDGTRVVTASDDRTAHVWEVASRKSVELKGHTRAVNSAVFSPDGARVVTASDDRTARVWEVSSGRSIELKGHAGAVRSAAFSPDGTRIVTTSDDRTARVWEVASGRKLAERDIGDTILTAAFAPDGARVVTTPEGKTTARVWEVESGRFVELKGHGGLVDSAVLSMDGSQVVTGSWDWSARAWEAASGRLIAEFDGHSSWVVSVALSPDGLRVLTASLDGTVRVWELTSGRVIAVLEGHNNPVYSTAFSSDGTRVVTASKDKTCVWRLDALPGDSEALLLWVQVFTGTEFQNGVVRPISSAEWQARREKLLEYGTKAPPIPILRDDGRKQ